MKRSITPLPLAAALLCAIALTPSSSRAQSPLWNESRVIRRASERSPLVQRALASSLEAQALSTYGAVSAFGNPTIGLRAMVGVPDVGAATYSVLLGVPIDVSGTRGQWRQEASWAVRESQAQLRAATNDARMAARHAWINVATADLALSVCAERAATAREALQAMRARFDAQSSTALDMALAEREVNEAELATLAAQRERTTAAAQLIDALDLEAGAGVFVEPIAEPTLPAGLNRESAMERARTRRAESAAFAAAAMRLRTSGERQRAQSVAPLFVAGEFEWQGYNQGTFGASVQWALPVVQTAQGERATASAQASLATTQRELSEREQARQAAAAWDALDALLRELRLTEDRNVPSLQRALALTQTLFLAGSVDYFRVLLARQELAAMQLRRVSMLRDAWRARVSLDHAIGSDAR